MKKRLIYVTIQESFMNNKSIAEAKRKLRTQLEIPLFNIDENNELFRLLFEDS